MTAALEVDRITVAYRSAGGAPNVVVDGFSLRLESGEIGCLTGPSGGGKTTVLRAIAGFEPLVAGSIRIGGEPVSSPQLHRPTEQRRVGMMFQDYALFPHLTAADNVGFGLRRLARDERAARVDEMLALVQLAGYGSRFPHELSGGQQQRIALARALAPSPSLLLLDEPFSDLDAATRTALAAEVRDILRRSRQSALMVTHDDAEARVMGGPVTAVAPARPRR